MLLRIPYACRFQCCQCVLMLLLAARRPGACLKSFVDVVLFMLTDCEYAATCERLKRIHRYHRIRQILVKQVFLASACLNLKMQSEEQT